MSNFETTCKNDFKVVLLTLASRNKVAFLSFDAGATYTQESLRLENKLISSSK